MTTPAAFVGRVLLADLPTAQLSVAQINAAADSARCPYCGELAGPFCSGHRRRLMRPLLALRRAGRAAIHFDLRRSDR